MFEYGKQLINEKNPLQIGTQCPLYFPTFTRALLPCKNSALRSQFLKKGLCSDKFSVRTVLGRCACTECERWVKDERIRDLRFLFLLRTSPKPKRKSQNEPKTMVQESAFF